MVNKKGREPKVGSFLLTRDGVSSGIVKRVGINVYEVDNGININKVGPDEIHEVL